jgi:hypothetical protein
MKTRIPILIFSMSLLLSSCITIRAETIIKEDGSGTKSFLLALDKSATSMMQSLAQETGTDSDDLWDAVRASAHGINNATIENYKDDRVEGIKVTIPFDNLEELQALSGSDAFEGTDQVTVNQDGDITTLKATVNTSDLAAGLEETGGQSLEDFDLGDVEWEYTYAVEIEGEVLSYSPPDNAQVNGNRVIWDLTQISDDGTELTLRWKPANGTNVVVIFLTAAALGGFILAGSGVIIMQRGRRPSTPIPEN